MRVVTVLTACLNKSCPSKIGPLISSSEESLVPSLRRSPRPSSASTWRLEVQDQPSRTLSTGGSVTVLGTCRRDWIATVGGGCRPSRPLVLSPWRTGNHLIRHDAHDHVSRRRDVSDAEIPRISKQQGYQATDRTDRCPTPAHYCVSSIIPLW